MYSWRSQRRVAIEKWYYINKTMDVAECNNGLSKSHYSPKQMKWNRQPKEKRRERAKKVQRQRCSSNILCGVCECVWFFILSCYLFFYAVVGMNARDALKLFPFESKKELKFSLFNCSVRASRVCNSCVNCFLFIDSAHLAFTHSTLKWWCLVYVWVVYSGQKTINSHGFPQLFVTLTHLCASAPCTLPLIQIIHAIFSYPFAIWQNQNGISNSCSCIAQNKNKIEKNI